MFCLCKLQALLSEVMAKWRHCKVKPLPNTYVYMYLFVMVRKSLKFTILFNEYHNWKKKKKLLVNLNRRICRSQMAWINLIKIHYTITSIRVPLETLPTKGKISNNVSNINNNNYNKIMQIIMIQKVITVILAIIITIKVLVMIILIEVIFCSFKLFKIKFFIIMV